MRKRFSSDFKAKVATEAIREKFTLQELATKYEVHPNQITEWKKELLNNMSSIFDKNKTNGDDPKKDKLISELYKKIGKKDMELEFLKKTAKKLGIL
jgi:transposase-like protein